METYEKAYFDRLSIVSEMAMAGLPMVGFDNFAILKGNRISPRGIGERYLEILKCYNCCGEGNRPHYLEVKIPGGRNEVVLRRFFDGLSGMQFYANRFYGVITFDFSSFEKEVEDVVLGILKEYLSRRNKSLFNCNFYRSCIAIRC